MKSTSSFRTNELSGMWRQLHLVRSGLRWRTTLPLLLVTALTGLGAEWRMTYGQIPADYQSTAATYTNEGFRPICLDVEGTGTAARYAAVWVRDGFTGWLTELDLTASQLSNRVDTLKVDGYRPLCIDAQGVYPGERYAGVWVKDERAADYTVVIRDLNWSTLMPFWERGYSPIWFDYPGGSSVQVTAISCKGYCNWGAWYGMDQTYLRERLEEYASWVWPAFVRTLNTSFSALWVDRGTIDGSTFRLELNQSAVELAHTLRQYLLDGYEPVSVTQSASTGTLLFDTVWRCPLEPLQPNRIDNARRLETGEAQLCIQNEVPADFAKFYELIPIQASTNLLEWQPALTVFKTNAATAPTLCLDREAVALDARFYRTPANRFITPNPKPTGPFAVGEFSRLLTDPARTNPGTGTSLQFMVTCWYPAQGAGGLLPAPFFEPSFLLNGAPYPLSRAKAMYTHSCEGAPVAPGQSLFPVLVYSPSGNMSRRDNLVAFEELASHGFVVVAFEHRDAPSSVFPDGTVVWGKPHWPITPDMLRGTLIPEYTADARFVIRTLDQWQASDPLLKGRLDVARIGAFGTAEGGSGVAQLVCEEPRCKAAAAIDANLIDPYSAEAGSSKPLLMLISGAEPGLEGDNRAIFFQHTQAPAYWLKIAGTLPPAFNCFALLTDAEGLTTLPGNAGITAARVHDMVRSALVSFFKRHLQQAEDGILDQLCTSPAMSVAMRRDGGPSITAPLSPTEVMKGESLILTVGATGQGTLKYEWLADDKPIAGATDSSLVIPAVTMASAGRYTVRVSDAAGTAACSAPVTVIPLRIATQPLDVTAEPGGTATFEVTVQSLDSAVYQWQRNGADIPGANQAALALTNLPADAYGIYTCRISTSSGSLNSAPAELRMRPTILEVPESQILRVGDMLELRTRAVGTLPMSFAWRLQGTLQSRLTRDEPLSCFQIPQVALTDAGVYGLVVTNAVGYASANILVPIYVVDPPQDQSAVAGSTVTFAATIGRRGAAEPLLQWQFNGADIQGATAATLTLSNIQPAQAGTYTLVVTSPGRCTASFPAVLRVTGN